MKKIITLLSVLILSICLSVSVFAIDIPQPTSDFFVNDFANVISEDDKDAIMQIGADIYNQTTAQVVVVTVDSLDGYEVSEYALELGREWGVGSEETNNGIVILLSVNDRKVTIQVGYGLEGAVTDSMAGRILDDYAYPYLSNDDFSTGLTEAYKALANLVCEEYGIMLDAEYEINNYDYYESTTPISDDFDEVINFVIALSIVGFVVIMVLLISGGSGHSGNDGNNGNGHHRGGGMFYGGFGGGFSGGSSSRGGFSGGGFRGGGGSFGGGGASRGF